MNSLKAVSYTHLDVYKRQVVNRLKGKVKYWLTYNEINLAPYQSDLVAGAYRPEDMSMTEMFAQLSINTAIAVSYTHLDVYKRQTYGCLSRVWST